MNKWFEDEVSMIEGNLLLKAVRKPVSAGTFWRLLLGAIAKLAFGYAGETGVLEAWISFSFGMGSWFCILKEFLMRRSPWSTSRWS